MKPEIVLVAVIICLAMMSVTPALTAPRQIQDLCSEQARHVTFSYRGDYEAFMATAHIEQGDFPGRSESHIDKCPQCPPKSGF